MKNYIYILLLCTLPIQLMGQASQPSLGLEQVIELAQERSIPAIRAKHKYLLSYWRYRHFKASYLPYISLNTNPINFNRSVIQRFDSEKNRDVFLPQQNIYSNANLSLYQRIGLTGGSVFLDSDIGRLQNIGESPITTYSVAPIRLGLIQPLFGFNEQKWEKQLEPLAFELAKKTYVADLESISLQVITLFFELLTLQNEYHLACENVTIADTLLGIARERLALGTLTQDDVLELELRQLNSQSVQSKTEVELRKTQAILNNFLGLAGQNDLKLHLPENLITLTIDPNKALSLARNNHPIILQGKYDKIVVDQEAEKTQKENGFSTEIRASIGLNQTNNSFSGAVNDLLDQEQINVSISIPILDWGRRKGRSKMAQSQQALVRAEVNQIQTDFERDIRIQVAQYSIQTTQVSKAKQSKSLAERRYEITRQRFLFGNIDLLKLTNAIQAKNQTQRQYIQSLQEFWENYYTLRYLTLYNFETESGLTVNMDKVIRQSSTSRSF
ncbi:MAG: TolC family protein [Bacteroidota bacterium]